MYLIDCLSHFISCSSRALFCSFILDKFLCLHLLAETLCLFLYIKWMYCLPVLTEWPYVVSVLWHPVAQSPSLAETGTP